MKQNNGCTSAIRLVVKDSVLRDYRTQELALTDIAAIKDTPAVRLSIRPAQWASRRSYLGQACYFDMVGVCEQLAPQRVHFLQDRVKQLEQIAPNARPIRRHTWQQFDI